VRETGAGRDDDLRVVEHEMAARGGGALYLRSADGIGLVVVHPDLDGPDRRWAIAHETAHHDLGVVTPPATPAMMRRAERRADQVAVEQLVDRAVLEQLVGELPEGEGITAGDVAEHFGIPVAVAELALQGLVTAR
jgi:Zn-dependent peptidase ImmA (M78 family)